VACDRCIIRGRSKKKAQPVEAALKVPPKEEVLEDCATACEAATQLDYPGSMAKMQAFAVAMHHIVDCL
jgi:hypothetical protein